MAISVVVLRDGAEKIAGTVESMHGIPEFAWAAYQHYGGEITIVDRVTREPYFRLAGEWLEEEAEAA